MCSNAFARSMSAEAADKPTEVANSPAMLSLSVACWQACAVCPNQQGLEKSRSQLDITALRVHRAQWVSIRPSLWVTNLVDDCKHCKAVANVGGECHDHRNCTQCITTDVLQVQSWVQVVGTSGSVPQTSRKSSRDGDGTTGALLTPIQSM